MEEIGNTIFEHQFHEFIALRSYFTDLIKITASDELLK